jgi:outer membrane receptor protein involved in Fe transport
VPNAVFRVGVLNLANKAPNTSNQAGYFRGFDQSVDATGRYVYVSMNYSYK